MWSFASSRVHKFSECLFKIDTKRTYVLDWCTRGQRQAKVYSSVLNVSGCIQKYSNVSKCKWEYPDVSDVWKCGQMCLNVFAVSKRIQVFLNVSDVFKCLQMWLSVSGCIWCVQICLEVSKSFSMYLNVFGRIWTYPNKCECTWVYLNVSPMFLNVSWCTSSDRGGLVSLFWFGWCQLLR